MSRPPASDFVAACAVGTFRHRNVMPDKAGGAGQDAPTAKPIATDPRKQKPKADEHDDADAAMVMYWRLRYACAPSRTAPEISCMRRVPASADIRLLIV